eukprot:scaffold180_cov311-Pinguiococcus_pyrenoidosus.AAC.46
MEGEADANVSIQSVVEALAADFEKDERVVVAVIDATGGRRTVEELRSLSRKRFRTIVQCQPKSLADSAGSEAQETPEKSDKAQVALHIRAAAALNSSSSSRDLCEWLLRVHEGPFVLVVNGTGCGLAPLRAISIFGDLLRAGRGCSLVLAPCDLPPRQHAKKKVAYCVNGQLLAAPKTSETAQEQWTRSLLDGLFAADPLVQVRLTLVEHMGECFAVKGGRGEGGAAAFRPPFLAKAPLCLSVAQQVSC